MTSEELMGELMVWHQGGDYDANALVALLPQSNLGVCVLTNSGSYEGSDLVSLAAGIFRAIQDPNAAVTRTPVLTVSSTPATGRYIAYGEVPESWLTLAGEYDGCTVVVEDRTMKMTGVGYLVGCGPLALPDAMRCHILSRG